MPIKANIRLIYYKNLHHNLEVDAKERKLPDIATSTFLPCNANQPDANGSPVFSTAPAPMALNRPLARLIPTTGFSGAPATRRPPATIRTFSASPSLRAKNRVFDP
jgi:hypothetical protein